jgi:hypothetical protein
MEECMRCGDTEFLVQYSTFMDGRPVLLCLIHTPIEYLEKGEYKWLKDTRLQTE